MQYESVLLTFAEVAAVFIGFIAVVLTLSMSGRARDKADRMHARVLLLFSTTMGILPFVPLVAHAAGYEEEAAWRMLGMIGMFSMLTLALVVTWFFIRLNKAELVETGVAHSVFSYTVATVSLVFFITGAFGSQPAASGIAALVTLYLLVVAAVFSFASQQLELFQWRE